jgi:GT2 family glycosyltransferase
MPSDCSLIIPTHNRRDVLDATLSRIVALPDRRFEIIVVDNGSTDGTPDLARRYPQVRWIELGANLGAAARNVGAVAARGRVLLMLDDDSWPAQGTVDRLVALFDARPRLGAAACRVRLADQPHRHDAGGVPGVFFNCGGAIRRRAFLEVGGFPIDYDYYVEEYDLCCRLWQRNWGVQPRGDMLVWHQRVIKNRDNDRMLRLLVRNNLRLWNRYAPAALRNDLIETTIDRYRRVALKENALDGFRAGLEEGRAETDAGSFRRSPLSVSQFENIFGLPTARQTLQTWADNHHVETIAVWTRGKGCEQLLSLLPSVSICVDAVYDRSDADEPWRSLPVRGEDSFDPASVDGIVVGTLSPGVAEDLRQELDSRFNGLPVLSAAPWTEPHPQPVVVPA